MTILDIHLLYNYRMGIVKNYSNYKKYLPEYGDWRDNQDLKTAKRLEYLKKHPEMMNSEDIQRGKNLLHAIDIMDEYSQSNAEDMEVATEFATSQIVALSTFIGTLAGAAVTTTKKVRGLISKYAKFNTGAAYILNIVPSVIGMLVGTVASFPAIVWSAKAQVSASRHGRFEAMRSDLKNPAIFAVLTPEQADKAEKEAKNIKLDDKILKRMEKGSGMGLNNPKQSISTLKKYYSKNPEYIKQKSEFETALKESEKQFDKPLSEKQIRSAKRDQQILADMVRKIDVASQDYAENTELATNTLTTLALGTGGLVGWVSNKLLKLFKASANSMLIKALPWGIGAAIPLAAAIYAAKVQKQASRIGRFKVKQEMLNNPASLVYVDEKELESISDVKLPQKVKKPNIFKFLSQLIKDNKAYTEYRKTKGIEELKLHKAIEKLELSEQQLQDAKALQMNVFKTFNKVDEKSQTYSEGVEALGEMTKQGVTMFGSLAAMSFSGVSILKMLKSGSLQNMSVLKYVTKILTPFAFVLLPVIAVDVYATKAQKKASRVADMLALKELEDYRHYVNYSDKQTEVTDVNTKSVQITSKTSGTNLLKRFRA